MQSSKKLLSCAGKVTVALALPFAFGSCESWNDMSDEDRGTIIGGAGGAVVGAAVTGKKVTGAILGGAAGALGGKMIGQKRDEDAALEDDSEDWEASY